MRPHNVPCAQLGRFSRFLFMNGKVVHDKIRSRVDWLAGVGPFNPEK